MTRLILTVVLILLSLLCLTVWGCCLWLFHRGRMQTVSRRGLEEKVPAYEKNAKLQSDFRVIRHDFANYVQAAGAFYDNEELKELVRKQKRSVRGLVEVWNRDADAFLNGHEGIL